MTNKINFDDYSKNYNQLLQKQHKLFGNIDYYSIYKIEILKKFINEKDNLNILEFGCGIGRNLSFIKSTFVNSNIYAYDISKESLKIAEKENTDIVFLDSNNINKMINQFDIIFIAGVYHHIPINERNITTKKIHDLLKDNGKVIIFEHNPYNPITVRMVKTCEFDKDAILLKMSELKALLSKNNLKINISNYSLFFPPKLSFFNPIEKYFEWLPLGGQYYIVANK